MSRADIEFGAQGATLRGWFYPAEGVAGGEAPCVVLQHGFAAVKEMWLDRYAEVFAAAGLACVVYDHPGFGASDAVPGTPRQEIDPWQQIRCIQHAITYACGRADVDAERIGLWGSSYAAAHAYVTATIDRRVRAVVGQVPAISGSQHFRELVRIDNWAGMDAMFAAERHALAGGAGTTMIPVVAEDPTAVSALPTPDSYLPLISPTPLLMVLAPNDRLAAGEIATAAYETAAHPKKVQIVPGGHFDTYTGPGFDLSSAAARDWFTEHLATKS